MPTLKYSFSGHESFVCKSLWLKKGYDFIHNQHNFNDADAVIYLGVGKNMVSSIRYWMKAFGLTCNDELTPLADLLMGENGLDQYLEDNFSLWILHYHLVKERIASIYNLTFLQLQREQKAFDKDQLLSFIKRKCSVPEQKNVYNENTVKKDIRVLLQQYVMPTEAKSLEEFSALLIDLHLIRKTNEDLYTFNETPVHAIDPLVIFYAMCDSRGDSNVMSFDQLQVLSLIFCLPMAHLIEIIQKFEIMYPKYIHYTDNSGVKNVHFLLDADKWKVLGNHYKQS
jgi:hypothetical protein